MRYPELPDLERGLVVSQDTRFPDLKVAKAQGRLMNDLAVYVNDAVSAKRPCIDDLLDFEVWAPDLTEGQMQVEGQLQQTLLGWRWAKDRNTDERYKTGCRGAMLWDFSAQKFYNPVGDKKIKPDGPLPQDTPFALFLYDNREMSPWVVFDLDAKTETAAKGSREGLVAAKIDVVTLAAALDHLEVPYFVDVSDNGGFHVYATTGVLVPAGEAKNIVTRIRRLLPTVDPCVGASAWTAIRPPGSPTKSGNGYQRLVTNSNTALWVASVAEMARETDAVDVRDHVRLTPDALVRAIEHVTQPAAAHAPAPDPFATARARDLIETCGIGRVIINLISAPTHEAPIRTWSLPGKAKEIRGWVSVEDKICLAESLSERIDQVSNEVIWNRATDPRLDRGLVSEQGGLDAPGLTTRFTGGGGASARGAREGEGLSDPLADLCNPGHWQYADSKQDADQGQDGIGLDGARGVHDGSGLPAWIEDWLAIPCMDMRFDADDEVDGDDETVDPADLVTVWDRQAILEHRGIDIDLIPDTLKGQMLIARLRSPYWGSGGYRLDDEARALVYEGVHPADGRYGGDDSRARLAIMHYLRLMGVDGYDAVMEGKPEGGGWLALFDNGNHAMTGNAVSSAARRDWEKVLAATDGRSGKRRSSLEELLSQADSTPRGRRWLQYMLDHAAEDMVEEDIDTRGMSKREMAEAAMKRRQSVAHEGNSVRASTMLEVMYAIVRAEATARRRVVRGKTLEDGKPAWEEEGFECSIRHLERLCGVSEVHCNLILTILVEEGHLVCLKEPSAGMARIIQIPPVFEDPEMPEAPCPGPFEPVVSMMAFGKRGGSGSMRTAWAALDMDKPMSFAEVQRRTGLGRHASERWIKDMRDIGLVRYEGGWVREDMRNVPQSTIDRAYDNYKALKEQSARETASWQEQCEEAERENLEAWKTNTPRSRRGTRPQHSRKPHLAKSPVDFSAEINCILIGYRCTRPGHIDLSECTDSPSEDPLVYNQSRRDREYKPLKRPTGETSDIRFSTECDSRDLEKAMKDRDIKSDLCPDESLDAQDHYPNEDVRKALGAIKAQEELLLRMQAEEQERIAQEIEDAFMARALQTAEAEMASCRKKAPRIRRRTMSRARREAAEQQRRCSEEVEYLRMAADRMEREMRESAEMEMRLSYDLSPV